MHANDSAAIFAATRAPSSPDSASGAAPAVAVASASAGSKRKSRAADDAAAAEAAVADSSSAAASSLVQLIEEDQPAADAAALSAAASNAHLGLLESPSAAAPVAKRTRRAHQSAQAAATHARVSPIIRLLGADSGARQSLMQLMDLSSIARLQCTGRLWCGWIAEASSIGTRMISIQGDQEDNPSRCPWVRRSVGRIQFEDSQDRRNEEGDVVPFAQLLLLRWSRLRLIEATLHRPLPSAELLQASFASVAATLQRLHVSLRWGASSSALPLLSAISPLSQLESLTISAMCDLTGLDLSALSSLPRLQQFVLRHDAARPCSLAQVDALAQCRSLTHLECGEWLPMRFSWGEPAAELSADQLQQLGDGLGRLLRLRKDNGAAPLRRLNLGSMSMVLPPCWRVLSQFTALEELDAHWSCTLTAADWMLLANFPRLHSLSIAALEFDDVGEDSRAPLNLGLVLPALLHCRALRTLKLDGGLELRTEHTALLAQIPSLETLNGRSLRVESLEPLSHAPALTALRLSWCAGLHGEPVNIRSMIPPMSLVTTLTIFDDRRSLLSASEAEPFNAALLARLPKLTLERFIQD